MPSLKSASCILRCYDHSQRLQRTRILQKGLLKNNLGRRLCHNSMKLQASDGEKSVLVPVADGSEEMEAVIIIDVLRRAGAQVPNLP